MRLTLESRLLRGDIAMRYLFCQTLIWQVVETRRRENVEAAEVAEVRAAAQYNRRVADHQKEERQGADKGNQPRRALHHTQHPHTSTISTHILAMIRSFAQNSSTGGRMHMINSSVCPCE
jgi:peptide methionine sulfoxide reductase MsrA